MDRFIGILGIFAILGITYLMSDSSPLGSEQLQDERTQEEAQCLDLTFHEP